MRGCLKSSETAPFIFATKNGPRKARLLLEYFCENHSKLTV